MARVVRLGHEDADPSWIIRHLVLGHGCSGPKTQRAAAHQAEKSVVLNQPKQPTKVCLDIKQLFFVLCRNTPFPLEVKDHASRVARSSLSPLGYIWKRLALHLFDIQVNSFPSSQPRLPVLAIWKARLEMNRQTLGRRSRKENSDLKRGCSKLR